MSRFAKLAKSQSKCGVDTLEDQLILNTATQAALTSARTSANAIYCPPLLQAALDMQSGVLHAKEKDYKTAFSYFFEAFEGYSSQDNPRAVLALKYMLLCKIMLNLVSFEFPHLHTRCLQCMQPEDIHAILSGKVALRYSGPDIDAMKAVASAHQNRNLQEFETALANYTNGKHFPIKPESKLSDI